MGKRAILSAAKKRGITVVSADYYWTVVPEEHIAVWEISFGPELDYETKFFDNAAQAVEFINAAELIAARPGGSDNDQVPTGNKTTHERNIMNEEQRKSFENAARPLIQWLCENVHPHHTVIVTPINAELLEGSCSTGQILDYVKD